METKINEQMLAALKFWKSGVSHFYECINFNESCLDAEAIGFMNEIEIKINAAIKNASEDS